MSSMGINPYASFPAAKAAQTAGATATPEAGASVIAEGVADFRTALQQAEKAAVQSAVSGADPHAMVAALANAEMVLDTVVTIRDKVVEAYQELLRMPV